MKKEKTRTVELCRDCFAKEWGIVKNTTHFQVEKVFFVCMEEYVYM